MSETLLLPLNLVEENLLPLDSVLEPKIYQAASGSIGHMGGNRSGEGWNTVGECINACYGPYIQLEGGRSYRFYWLVSGPVFDCESDYNPHIIEMDICHSIGRVIHARNIHPLFAKDICRKFPHRPNPGMVDFYVGFEDVRFDTDTPNVECRLTTTGLLPWLLIRQLVITRSDIIPF